MPRKIVKSKSFFEEDFIESVSEVSTNEWKKWPDNSKLDVVGKDVNRYDGYDKVSGTALYTFDVELPNMAHARILGSPHPHAKIKKINTEKAKKLPGVLAVMTADNAPDIKWYSNTTFLFDKRARHEGDEVACVVAETDQIAEEALHLIEVEYETLPFAVEASEAMKSNAPKVHDDGNLRGNQPSKYSRGDVEKAFAESDVVIENEYETQVEIHNPTEFHCSVVNWDGDNLDVWDSTQSIFGVRNSIADALNLPQSNVRVIKKYMGGGFGSKLEAGKYSVIAALLAKKIGRPIKIYMDRIQMMLSVGNRPDSFQRLKFSANKDGKLTGMFHYSYAGVGAYPAGGGCSWPLRTIYKCDNVATEEYSVYTNAGRARAFRAPGHVQGTFALEMMIDEVAEKIGMDPLDFRMKNYAEVDQVINNNPYTSKLLMEAYKKGAEAIGWYENRKAPGAGDGYLKTGYGVASQIWWGGGSPPSYATIKLNRDGSATVISGTQDIGTGTYTFIAQVAAEVLEIPIEKIKVLLGDTAVAPYSGGSGGSQTAPSVSPAVRDAAEMIKQKLVSSAAVILNLPEDSLEYSKGEVFDKNAADKKLSIGEILREIREQTIVATGARSANKDNYAINSFGAQFAKVEVDTLTGRVRVKRIVAAHDIGRVLNRKTLENQFHGGVIQGLGFALMEKRWMDRNTGKMANLNLHDYKMATIMDSPPEIDIIIVSEGDDLISNTGVKGIGEPAMIPTPGAIANAVYNAIGKRIKSLPITPDKVLNALYS